MSTSSTSSTSSGIRCIGGLFIGGSGHTTGGGSGVGGSITPSDVESGQSDTGGQDIQNIMNTKRRGIRNNFSRLCISLSPFLDLCIIYLKSHAT
jgi:hypothetical protein